MTFATIGALRVKHVFTSRAENGVDPDQLAFSGVG